MDCSGTAPLERIMRPCSVAVVGVSPEPGSIGALVLGNLERWRFAGDVHLVSRTRKDVGGRPCVTSIDELPPGIDVAVLAVPRVAAIDAVAACARRKIGAAFVFAAGFAEVDEAGRADQTKLQDVARQAGVRLLGPNCMGLTNYADGIPLTFEPLERRSFEGRPTVAVITQSGALASIIRNAFFGKGLGLSYVVSSGNEADLTCEDFLAFLLDDAQTRAVALFVEQIRHPRRFLALAERARARRKPIILAHPGRSERARASALTHTGALTGNHAVMTALLHDKAVIVVDTLDELYDVTDILARFEAPTSGAGIITNSGAVKGFVLDFCDEIGLDLAVPAMSTMDALKRALPPFAPIDNPLDVTAQVIKEPAIWTAAVATLLADPGVGSLCLPMVPGAGGQAQAKVDALLPAIRPTQKPTIIAAMGDEFSPPPEFEAFRRNGIPLVRSPERALRALAHTSSYGRALRDMREPVSPALLATPPLPGGAMPEYLAKPYLAQLGIAIPAGALAHSLAQAQEIAARVGYPVALKAQSRAVAHKSDAGGVVLSIASEAALRQAWQQMQDNFINRTMTLDGILVEAMASPGVEMIVGARRDRDWGPVVLAGLGGIWAEALDDVRLMPPGLPKDRIIVEIGRLRGAALLRGSRGKASVDVAAVAEALACIGALMQARTEISEIDINPLVVYAKGAIALDALIVASS